MPLKRINLYIVLVLALLAQNSFANTLLPASSYYDGKVYFNAGDNRLGKIEFAVYDTQTVNEFTSGGFADAPGSGRYIYAYQIFCDTQNTNPINFFAVLGIGEGALTPPKSNNIGYVNDNAGGSISPNDAFVSHDDTYGYGDLGAWEFLDISLTANKQSWFLVLRSNQGWTAGEYTFDPNFGNSQLPRPDEIPEPATLALFGFGLGSLLLRNKKVSDKILSH